MPWPLSDEEKAERARISAIVAASLAVPLVDNSNDTLRQSRAERKKNKPGKFWARSSAGVYLNNTYVRRQGLP